MLDRLDEIPRDSQFFAAVRIFSLTSRRQHDERAGREPRILPDPSGHFETVHVRHHHIQQSQLKRLATGNRFIHDRQRLGAAGSHTRPHPPVCEYVFEDSSICLVVVDHQHRHRSQLFELEPRLRRSVCGDSEADGKVKRTALAEFALDPQLPAHQLDQLHRDVESEPGAAIPPRRRCVRLTERFENLLLLFDRNSNPGIRHDKVQVHLRILSLFDGDDNDDFAFLRELQGVPDEVNDDLSKPSGIAHERIRHVRRHQIGELHSLFGGSQTERVHRIAETVPQLEINRLQFELPCFHFRKIQNVVEQSQQRVG